VKRSFRFRAVFVVLAGFWFTFTSTAVEAQPGQSEGHFDPDRRAEGDDYVPNEILVKFREKSAATLAEWLRADKRGEELKVTESLDELRQRYPIRKMKRMFPQFQEHTRKIETLKNMDPAQLLKGEQRLQRRLARAPLGATVPTLDRIYKMELELHPGQSLQEALAAYQNDPEVEFAELNTIVRAHLVPNDPRFPVQWAWENTGQIYPASGNYNDPPGTPDCDIDAPEAWEIYTGNSEIIVAVIDTGVNYSHRDLDDNMWRNPDEEGGSPDVDDDGNGFVDDIYGYDFLNEDNDPNDDNGHGTHCAGIIAAEGNNGLDIAGVCWAARIMALKFLNQNGSGPTSAAAEAIYYAVANGADVVSNSWGGGNFSETLNEAIAFAHSQGAIVVASAGNDYTDEPQYPGAYDHVIAVAATDSNDDKPNFSNYGDWVDIAAPGVDILSLLATGVSKGTVYDETTTVLSGTSMACPFVAGACALLLATEDTLTEQDVYDILMNTVDPIADGICQADGRINLFQALQVIVSSAGYVRFQQESNSCNDNVGIFLADHDLAGQGTHIISITTARGDVETVSLSEKSTSIGIYTGSITTQAGDPNTEDGVLQVIHDEMITVHYDDADNGTGSPVTVTDTAVADCEGPAIFNLQVDTVGPEPSIQFETDEPTTARVLCGTACGGNYFIVGEDATSATSHTVYLVGVVPETDYYFIVEATDRAGNITVDDNAGACYGFTSDVGPRDILVPDEYGTIQEAIDHSWHGGTVWVADGIYQGQGNRDLDFKKRAITVRSVNGPENCIIDCEGSVSDPHRGFYFHRGEDPNSKLIGFTIQNGYGLYNKGGGIRCLGSSPTIEDCNIRDCHAHYGGGMYNEQGSNPNLRNCTFENNLAEGAYGWGAVSDGGGMYNHESHPTLTNCRFIGNRAFGEYDAEMYWPLCGGGGMYNYVSSPTLRNCSFIANTGISEKEGLGGGMYNYQESSPYLEDCTFDDNVMGNGGGMCNWDHCNPVLIRCTFRRNSGISYDEGETGGGMYNREYSYPTLEDCLFEANQGGGMENRESSHAILRHCTFRNNYDGGIQNYGSDTVVMDCYFIGNQSYRGGGVTNSYCDPVLINCTFQGNVASWAGGGVYQYWSNPKLIHCVFTGNVAEEGGAIHTRENSNPVLVNCTVAGNQALEGRALYVNASMQDYPSSIQATNCIFWNGGDEIRHEGGVVTFDIRYSCVQDEVPNDGLIYPGIGNIDTDPRLLDVNGADNVVGTEDDNVVLLAGSPCLDAGDNTAIPEDQYDLDDDSNTSEPIPWDRAGNPRFVDDPEALDTGNPGWGMPLVDMGAYEGSHQGFLVSTEFITVPEGDTALFTVALARDPGGTVPVEVVLVTGDPDISIAAGAALEFDSSNYAIPQSVTLAAAEDADYFHHSALLEVRTESMYPAGITAVEVDNEAAPSILYVDGRTSTEQIHFGRSWIDALSKLQDALSITHDYPSIQEIHVAGGVYTPADPNGPRQATFTLVNRVSLQGGFAGIGAPDPNQQDPIHYPTILSGDLNANDNPGDDPFDLLYHPTRAENSYTVLTAVEVEETTVVEGCTICGGNANIAYTYSPESRAGGLYIDESDCRIRNCIFTNNSAEDGGAVYSDDIAPSFSGCLFEGNLASDEGGAVNIDGGRPILENCTFQNNTAQYTGGGMYIRGGRVQSLKCRFEGNRAQEGGGIYNRSQFDTLIGECVFQGNRATGRSGAIHFDYRCKAVVKNSLITGNCADGDGGALYSYRGDLDLQNCTVAGNRAGRYGGGLDGNYGTLILTNSIFWNNRDSIGDEERSQLSLFAIEPEIRYCNILGWTGDWNGPGNFNLDPDFAQPGFWDPNDTPHDKSDDFWVEGDYHFKSTTGRWNPMLCHWVQDQTTSPCIDTADTTGDWSAELWPHGKRANMGAYGGTVEASMSPDTTVGNIADLNLDGKVNLLDYDLLTDRWPQEEFLWKEDLNRNGRVDAVDLEILCENWLWEE
jgi:predicted outer membrane repeat protein